MMTQAMAITLWSTFLVAINRMKKAKAIDEMIPFLALLTKASSVGIHGQIPLVCAKIFKPYGAVFSHLFVKSSKD